ncbi:MAG: hypothetical protein ACTSRZ_16315 [Promethearchaeota archaeon]
MLKISANAEENLKSIVSGTKKLSDFSLDEVREMIIYKRDPAKPEGFKVLKVNDNDILCQLWNGMKVHYIYENGDFRRKL